MTLDFLLQIYIWVFPMTWLILIIGDARNT